MTSGGFLSSSCLKARLASRSVAIAFGAGVLASFLASKTGRK